MSKNELVTFGQSGKLVIPDYITESYGDLTNLTGRKTLPSLSFEGKTWQANVNGQKHQFTTKNLEGDVTVAQTIRVCIVEYNNFNGHAYYEATYDPNKPGAPRCWSDDGINPAPAVPSPIAVSCKACAFSKKGSKINASGQSARACGVHRLLCVIPMTMLDVGPLRMKIAGTSIYEDSEELKKKGWYGFSAYLLDMAERGAKHLSTIVTKMTFDPNVAFPKVLFQAERFLTKDELQATRKYVNSDEVKALLGGRAQEGDNGSARPILAAQAMPPQSISSSAGTAPLRIATPVIESAAIEAAAGLDDDEEPEAPPPKQSKTKVKQTKKPAEDLQVVEAEPQAVVKSPSASPKVTTSDDPGLAAILDDWGND